jgi:signal transduction histidine kinase
MRWDHPRVKSSSVRVLAGGSFAVSAILSAGAAVFLVLAWDTPMRLTEFGTRGYAIVWSLVVGGVGAVLASLRPRNPIGWIFCGLGLLAGILAFTSEYARWAIDARHGIPPGGVYAAWLVEWIWIPLITGLAVVAGIFPDGRFLTRGWRRAMWAAIAISLVPTALTAVIPRLTVYAGVNNPVGVGGRGVRAAAVASTTLMVPVVVVGAAAIVRRFRRSRGEERLQLKWLTLSTILVAAMFAVYGVLVIFQGTVSPEGPRLTWLEDLTILAFLAVPVSVAFGVLKYRLYDIDIVINKAVVYGAIAVFITAVYLLVVIGVGSLIGYASNPVLSAIAAAIIALAFQPARRGAQRLANRFVYGRRSTPYEVLSQLSSRFANAYSLDDALPRLAHVSADAVGAERATVWLRADGTLRPTASWPTDGAIAPLPMPGHGLPSFGPRETGFAVRHQGDPLGAVSVVMPANEPLGPAQRKLLEDVAAQTGLVLRNVGLLEDLRASRRRLVAAQDAERRRLERNIHDGAQQQLVALQVKQHLAEGMIERAPGKARELMRQLQGDTAQALEDLRDLARGIYPPLLADKGLETALESQARKSPVPVTVESDSLGRYAQVVEAAVYFCALEALNNLAKYARASTATVSLSQVDGMLTFEVADDGVGFELASATGGTGLQGMADRLEAIGGMLEVDSAVGSGTIVRGRVPIGGAP